jgi:hypothetical protein
VWSVAGGVCVSVEMLSCVRVCVGVRLTVCVCGCLNSLWNLTRAFFMHAF